MRLQSWKTRKTLKNQLPVWEETFCVPIVPDARMIQLIVYEMGSLTEKELGRVKLNFSYIPEVEANFADRSLLYGLDGIHTFPKLHISY